MEQQDASCLINLALKITGRRDYRMWPGTCKKSLKCQPSPALCGLREERVDISDYTQKYPLLEKENLISSSSNFLKQINFHFSKMVKKLSHNNSVKNRLSAFIRVVSVEGIVHRPINHNTWIKSQDYPSTVSERRLLAVERAREIAESASASYQQRCEIRARRKTREKTGEPFPFLSRRPPFARSLQVSAFLLGYFARPLDYPERAC